MQIQKFLAYDAVWEVCLDMIHKIYANPICDNINGSYTYLLFYFESDYSY